MKNRDKLNEEKKCNYLTVNSDNHLVDYDLFEFENKSFHVATLKMMQKDDTGKWQATAAYIIEPIDEANLAVLQNNFLDIIRSAKERAEKLTYGKRTSPLYMYPGRKSWPKNLDILETKLYSNPDEVGAEVVKWIFTIHIPTLVNISEFFKDKILATNSIEVEGVIKNKKLMLNREDLGTVPDAIVKVDYTVNGPFAMVYEGPKGSYNCTFPIADPKNELIVSFKASDASDSVATKGIFGRKLHAEKSSHKDHMHLRSACSGC